MHSKKSSLKYNSLKLSEFNFENDNNYGDNYNMNSILNLLSKKSNQKLNDKNLNKKNKNSVEDMKIYLNKMLEQRFEKIQMKTKNEISEQQIVNKKFHSKINKIMKKTVNKIIPSKKNNPINLFESKLKTFSGMNTFINSKEIIHKISPHLEAKKEEEELMKEEENIRFNFENNYLKKHPSRRRNSIENNLKKLSEINSKIYENDKNLFSNSKFLFNEDKINNKEYLFNQNFDEIFFPSENFENQEFKYLENNDFEENLNLNNLETFVKHVVENVNKGYEKDKLNETVSLKQNFNDFHKKSSKIINIVAKTSRAIFKRSSIKNDRKSIENNSRTSITSLVEKMEKVDENYKTKARNSLKINLDLKKVIEIKKGHKKTFSLPTLNNKIEKKMDNCEKNRYSNFYLTSLIENSNSTKKNLFMNKKNNNKLTKINLKNKINKIIENINEVQFNSKNDKKEILGMEKANEFLIETKKNISSNLESLKMTLEKTNPYSTVMLRLNKKSLIKKLQESSNKIKFIKSIN